MHEHHYHDHHDHHHSRQNRCRAQQAVQMGFLINCIESHSFILLPYKTLRHPAGLSHRFSEELLIPQ